MIFRLTAKLAQKIGLNPLPALPYDKGMPPLLDWHAHLFTVQRTQYILATNTASLYSLVMPGRGITNGRQFIQALSSSLRDFLAGQGQQPSTIMDLLASGRDASFAKITDRRLLGSMNDLTFQSKFRLEEGQQTLFTVSYYLNETPLSYLKYRSPKTAFQELLRQAGESAGHTQKANNVIYLNRERPTAPDSDPALEDYDRLQSELIRDKAGEIFRVHPRDPVAEMENLGFTYCEDDTEDEEKEERNARPTNRRQQDLVAYFEGRKPLSEEIFAGYSEEKAAEQPNYPLIRKYYKVANQHLKALLLYGLENHIGRIDLLSDLAFFHEFENCLRLLIAHYTRACIEQENLGTFTELAKDFYYSTSPDGYEAYQALQELFGPDTAKRKIIDSLIAAEEVVSGGPGHGRLALLGASGINILNRRNPPGETDAHGQKPQDGGTHECPGKRRR